MLINFLWVLNYINISYTMSPKLSHPLCFLISVMKCLNKTIKKCLTHIDLVCNSHSNKIYLFCVSKEGFKFYKLFKPHLIGYGLRSNFYLIKRSPLLLILDVIIRSQK